MPDGEVAPYAFGSDEERSFGELHALHLLNERLARAMRQVFQPMLWVQPKVSAAPVLLDSFAYYSDGFDDFLSLNIIRMEQLRAQALAVLHTDLIGELAVGGASVRDRVGHFGLLSVSTVYINTKNK